MSKLSPESGIRAQSNLGFLIGDMEVKQFAISWFRFVSVIFNKIIDFIQLVIKFGCH